MDVLDRLIHDSIDMHIHVSPDHARRRRSGAVELARRAKELEMGGIVIKSHYYDTTPVAVTAMEAEPGLQVIGGIALNTTVGGLNPAAVEACAGMGGRIVWMPTRDAAADRRRSGKEGGIDIRAEGGGLRPELIDIIKIIKAHDLILATGHIAPEESLALVETARGLGVEKILITHAAQHFHTQGMTVDQVKQFVRLGAYVEYCAHAMTPFECDMAPQLFVEMIRKVGPEHCVFSTDFGQTFTPIAPEGFRMSMGGLLEAGMSEEEVRVMAKDNPRRLLGL